MSTPGMNSIPLADPDNVTQDTAIEQVSINFLPPQTIQMPMQRTGGRRGRGLRRRGGQSGLPRNSQLLRAVPDANTAASTPSKTSPSSRGGRGGQSSRSNGHKSKRKRGQNGDDDGNASDGSSSDENFTSIPSYSMSGRKITQAQSSRTAPIEIEDDEPAPQTQSQTNTPSKATAKPKLTPRQAKSKVKPKRIPGPSSLCKHCGRSHSPVSNVIVFCDSCNKGWHKHCHDPRIPDDVIAEVDKDWFCGDCMLLREEQMRLSGRISGSGMTLVEKRKYLSKVPQRDLISMLIQACVLHPNLPIYRPKTYIENGYEYIQDEEKSTFPKPGNGVVLRPESEDHDILVDDNMEVFSHTWKGVSQLIARAPYTAR